MPGLHKTKKLKNKIRYYGNDPSLTKFLTKEIIPTEIIGYKSNNCFIGCPYIDHVWTEDKLGFPTRELLVEFCNELKIKFTYRG